MANGAEMLAHLRERGITDERLLAAMASVPRHRFVPAEQAADAYSDRALPIGHGQTISQPLMVALLVEALLLEEGDRAFDVGTGSGYQAAVMAACGAQVTSIERLPELAASAALRLDELGYAVDVVVGDGSLGLPGAAPFDAIAVGAAAPRLPVHLARQLREGGRLVVPVTHGDDSEMLVRLTVRDGQWLTDNLGPCRFVPLIGADAYASPDV